MDNHSLTSTNTQLTAFTALIEVKPQMDKLLRIAAIGAAALLSACGTTKVVKLYEPFDGTHTVVLFAGDSCSEPSFGSFFVGPHLSLNVRDQNGAPELTLKVLIQGASKFRFSVPYITITDEERSAVTLASLPEFRIYTAGALRKLRGDGVLAAPEPSDFSPHYRETTKFESEWHFTSDAIRILPSGSFSVQVPDAVVDGRIVHYQRMTYRPVRVTHWFNCWK